MEGKKNMMIVIMWSVNVREVDFEYCSRVVFDE